MPYGPMPANGADLSAMPRRPVKPGLALLDDARQSEESKRQLKAVGHGLITRHCTAIPWRGINHQSLRRGHHPIQGITQRPGQGLDTRLPGA